MTIDTDNPIILDAFLKCSQVFDQHEHALVSISGGADSDCMLDLCERVRKSVPIGITYVWFDTGLEYAATKRHLDRISERYGVEIVRFKPLKSIPTCVREFGQPFLSKYVSTHMERLQKHGFAWEEIPYESMLESYPRCVASVKWWCDKWTRTSEPGWFDIGRFRLLREFIVKNPPWFKVSNKCCEYTKKKVAAQANREFGVDLELIGIRKSEGGARSTISQCFSRHEGGVDTYRPLLWFSDADKADYERQFGITHSDCYKEWGFRRTGCVGCPFGKKIEWELDTAKRYEPNLVRAARSVFADSYKYTSMYRAYVAEHSTGQMRLDLRHARIGEE